MAVERHAALKVVLGHGKRLWFPIFGVVILLSLMDALQTYVANALQGRPTSLTRALLVGFCLWLPLGGLVRPALWMAVRFRFDTEQRWRSLAIHLPAGAIFACLLLLITSALRIALGLRTAPDFLGDLWMRFAWLFGVDLFIYWVIVGSYYALYYYQLASEREFAAGHLRATLTESRLQALRAQLNPHFLFNTLNAISVMAMQGNQEAVVSTIGRLGDLLRVSLDDSLPQRLPLAAELEFLDGYLDIQRIRFADRLAIDQDIAPDTRRALVPSLILQPLVENAIVHGIASRAAGGRVTIRASRENGALKLSVSDTGDGIRLSESARKGIGLSNTSERLLQLYGTDQHIEYGVGVQGGGIVVITIPFEEQQIQAGVTSPLTPARCGN
jgi:two-component system, LytTR family, sensor kinase